MDNNYNAKLNGHIDIRQNVVLILLSLRLYLLTSSPPPQKIKGFQTMNGNFKLHKQQP